MKSPLSRVLMLWLLLTATTSALADSSEFSFGVIPRETITTPDDAALREAIEESNERNLAFVVANGIKAAGEPCTDAVYIRRKSALQSAKHGLVLSLAGSDWANCRSSNGRSTAVARLTRLRELFFVDEFSMGATRIPLVRQATVVKFDDFVENVRWEIGGVMFATLNLPAPNNHYVVAAGRNGEFEDRLVANRDWLNRIFLHAKHDRLTGIVLFSDGNPLVRGSGRRDGFIDTRKEILKLARNFRGKVLIVHGQPKQKLTASMINWRGNVGDIGVASRWLQIAVKSGKPALFSVKTENAREDIQSGERR